MPKFSIIIPTFNRGHLIKDTLLSFQNQSFENFEVLIIDDGGKDNTADVIKSLNDDRFKYYWKENAERGAARNYGANIAKGEFLNFFDDDDIAYPNHLETANEVTKNNNSIELFCQGQEVKDVNGKIFFRTSLKSEIGNQEILLHNFVTPNSIFVKIDLWQANKYSENRNLSGSEDWLFIILLSLQKKFYCFIDIITNCIIQHDNRSMITATGESTILRTNEMIKELRNQSIPIEIICNVKAEMYSLSALHYALEKNKIKSIKYLYSAIINRPQSIFRRRTLAIIKHNLI